MAKKAVNENAITANAVEETEKNAENEQKYLVTKLRENSIQLFGVSKSTFDGAMYGHTAQEYTINEVKDILNEWLYGGKEGK